MKYSVGQKVKIRSLEWYRDNVNRYGIIECGKYEFFEPMNEYCGKVVTIKRIDDDNYRIDADKGAFCWTDEMIEGLVDITQDRVDKLACKIDKELPSGNPYEWECPKGYIFKDENGNVINATKIVLENKKKEYPKTYEECCEIMDCAVHPYITANEPGIVSYYEDDLNRGVLSLRKLLICRDAYWKIYGEEMGLGKPWKPDWAMYSGLKHCIIYSDNQIKWQGKHFVTEAKVLAFPTAELRDAFYENFKEEIEICKELL